MKVLNKIACLSAAVAILSACGGRPQSLSTVQGTPLENRGCGYGSLERNDGVIPAMEAEIFRRTNEFRAQNGRPALLQHGCIDVTAIAHSVNMAKQNNASHVLDGLDARGRLLAQDINVSWWGENIQLAWWTQNGQPAWDATAYPGIAMNFWINSPGHRANMLNANYRFLGVGISKTQVGDKGYYYATQVFLTE